MKAPSVQCLVKGTLFNQISTSVRHTTSKETYSPSPSQEKSQTKAQVTKQQQQKKQ
jgi:hypothetical protein